MALSPSIGGTQDPQNGPVLRAKKMFKGQGAWGSRRQVRIRALLWGARVVISHTGCKGTQPAGAA